MRRKILIVLMSISFYSCGCFSNAVDAMKTADEAEQIAVRVQENAREVNEVLHQVNLEVDEVIKFIPGEHLDKVKGIKRGVENAIRLNSHVVKLADEGEKKAKEFKEQSKKQAGGSLDKWVKASTQAGLILLGFGIMAYSYLCPGRGHTAAGLIISSTGIMLVSYWDLVAELSFYALGAFALYFIFIFIKHRNLKKAIIKNG